MAPTRRRAGTVLVLLLAIAFGPWLTQAPAGAGARAAAAARDAIPVAPGPDVPDRAQTPSRAHAGSPAAPGAAEGAHDRVGPVPAADPAGSGGSCRPQELPFGGSAVALPHPHGDPFTAPAAVRDRLPADPAVRPSAPRAPPVPVAGCAELLPVLRI
ncbi:hypothetical protein ACFP1Z_09555 [Streptomyces gamaensis]|uniref:Secreted protein n=1 Tax=Streptomyces gamaensis TaxID=1763542 RepID=A0ABW0Z212_9ACTN